MPLYEYECQQCQRHTEKRQKFSDPEITTCPHCGGHLQRVISAPNIAFKGGGWYKDLYSSPKPASSNESKGDGSDTKSDRDSKGESKGESKGDSAAGSDSSPKPATSSGADTSSAAPAKAPTPPSTPTSAPAPNKS